MIGGIGNWPASASGPTSFRENFHHQYRVVRDDDAGLKHTQKSNFVSGLAEFSRGVVRHTRRRPPALRDTKERFRLTNQNRRRRRFSREGTGQPSASSRFSPCPILGATPAPRRRQLTMPQSGCLDRRTPIQYSRRGKTSCESLRETRTAAHQNGRSAYRAFVRCSLESPSASQPGFRFRSNPPRRSGRCSGRNRCRQAGIRSIDFKRVALFVCPSRCWLRDGHAIRLTPQ